MTRTPATPSRLRTNPVARLLRRDARAANTEPRRGAVALEMAIVMTFIFAPMLLGIIEFGRMMMVGQIITTASRYGARHAILEGSTNAEVVEMVEDYVSGSLGIDPDKIRIDIDITPDGANPQPADIVDAQRRDMVEVEVGVPWNDVALIKGQYLTGKEISQSAAMRHE